MCAQLRSRRCRAGGLAGKESDVAADEAAALSNIHGLLDSLERQRQSMLASLDATEVHCILKALPDCPYIAALYLWDMRCTHTVQHEHIVRRLMSSHKTADGRVCRSLLCTLLISIEMRSSLARITTWRCVWSLQDEVLRNGNILETDMCTSAQCCSLLTAGGEQETCEHKQGPLRALGVCTAAAGAGHFQVAACLCATSSSSSNSTTCISTGESANRYSVPQSAPQRLSGRMKHS